MGFISCLVAFVLIFIICLLNYIDLAQDQKFIEKVVELPFGNLDTIIECPYKPEIKYLQGFNSDLTFKNGFMASPFEDFDETPQLIRNVSDSIFKWITVDTTESYAEALKITSALKFSGWKILSKLDFAIENKI